LKAGQIIRPDRAWNRSVSVPQLEIGLLLRLTQSGDLADQLNPRSLPQLIAKRFRVAANRKRTR
jgi:hypothetical protein